MTELEGTLTGCYTVRERKEERKMFAGKLNSAIPRFEILAGGWLYNSCSHFG